MCAPAAPDPWETAKAQSQWNTTTAQTQQALNMSDQVNPWGTTAWDQIGTQTIIGADGNPVDLPRYRATTTLSPAQQAIFDRTQQAQGNLAGLASDQSAKMREYLSTPFEFDNQDAETWAWDLASPRILAQQQQNEDALRTRLVNSGLRPGTSAWDSEMTRLTNANTDQMNQLALTGRQQAFGEALASRNQPINELSALLGGTQVANPAQMSAQTPQTGVAGVDYTGLVNQKYQGELQSHQAMMGGLFGLLGAGLSALPFSDVRLKDNIRRVGSTDAGLPVYTFTYKDDPDGQVHMGVMAQEALEEQPDIVGQHPSGFLMVDYSKVR